MQDPYPSQITSLILASSFSTQGVFEVLSIIILIFLSGVVSGSESAFFSLSKSQQSQIQDLKTSQSKTALRLLSEPKYLLATILIANTLINITIAIVSKDLLDTLLSGYNETLKFIIEIASVTFLLVLFGEISPKIYASYKNIQYSLKVSWFMYLLNKIFFPISWILVNSTGIIEKRFSPKTQNIRIEEIKQAIDLTVKESGDMDEKRILKGIVSFSTTNVKQVMTNRVDICAIKDSITVDELINFINTYEYSRIPVYKNNIDEIVGVIYIKDLLGKFTTNIPFDWQELIRDPYFVPESKMIDDLLEEFQLKKIHLAIAVDEYGGTAGLVTMEDILEEIVGEIKDEFDDDEQNFKKDNEGNFIFNAKTSLNDVLKITELEDNFFEDAKGEAESIGGFMIELFKKLPKAGEEITHKEVKFRVEASDKKRIKEVKVSLPFNSQENNQ